MSSIQQSDADAAAVAVAPRVSLEDIERSIKSRFIFTGATVANHFDPAPRSLLAESTVDALATLTICILVMHNGFTVIGKSAPASRENFNAELGRKFAYEDAIRQLWPLMGYALRDKLHQETTK